MDPGLLRDALTVGLGLLTGIMSGLFGVGGAVISTPGIRALGASPILAVGTTLPSIIPGAASGTARYAREGMVDWSVVAITAPAGIVAAVVGALAADHVPGEGHVLMLMTAALLAYSAWRMFPRDGGEEAVEPGEPLAETDVEALDGAPGHPATHHRRLAFATVGIVAGTLSGLLGIGGGIVMVPGFTQVGDLSVKRAIATSLACVGLFAVPGTITHALLGNIDWRFALLLCVGVIPGARIGAALAIAAGDRRLRRVVAAFLGLMALAYGVGETLALLG
ncbi:MAG: sulfite exporter TauE/SafE family protein [Acidimicrobiales bacterium]|nr:sulfite exporter TauE/SafE family protein [Acidimicrobiales bacterium]